MMRLTPDLIMSLGPCPDWPRSRVEELLSVYGGEVEHAVLLRDQRVPPDDREWLGRKLLEGDDALLRFYAADCAEHALNQERAAGQEPDPRSVAAVEVARRYARRRATKRELSDARTDARSAAWADDGRSACKAAHWAVARDAAEAAEGAAASAAVCLSDLEWQVKKLITYLNGKES